MSTTDIALPAQSATRLPPPLSAKDLAISEAQALHAETDGYYGQFEISKLRASPDNRKRFNEQALQELAESIKTMGVAQAILIRPVTPTEEAPQAFEIVAGERRFRASRIAGKTHIPALCRTLSDLDAAKIRILENLQREDPHPMEEAEGYQLLMLQHGFTADQLVNEVKKSRAYIYGRLKLCALTTEVRELFLDNQLPASTALLIARIPVPALQVKAASEILHPPYGEPLSYRRAADHVQNRYMLDLDDAVFSLTDAKLLATAGACMKCPKRAGNQPEVFEGIDANFCTDPDCFGEKKAAHYNALITQANKKGIPIHEGVEATMLLQQAHVRTSELVHAGVHLTYFDRNAPATKNAGWVRNHLSSESLPPAAAYTKRSDGEVVPLYRRVDIQHALEAAGACETVEQHLARMQAVAENPGQAPDKTPAQLKREKEDEERAARHAQQQRESAFRLALYKQLRQRASIAGLSLLSLREYVKAVHDEHGLDSDIHDLYEFDVRSEIDNFINQADANALQLLLLDLMLGARLDATWWHGDEDDDEFGPIIMMARHEGIDVDAVRAKIFSPAPEQQAAGTEPVATTGTESAPAAIEAPDVLDDASASTMVEEPPAAVDQVVMNVASPTVRYRNPDDPAQTWTGRGKQPKWVSDWVASGKSLDGLQVNAAPVAVDQVEGERLAEQLAAPAKDVQTSAPDKKAEAKPVAKSSSSKKTPAKAKASK